MVRKTAQLDNIILYAPKIEIEDGFTGSLQLFACDTLLVGEKCTLRFPSFIAVMEPTGNRPIIEIKKDTRILGDVVMLSRSESKHIIAECRVGSGTSVSGTIFCEGRLELNGSVSGQIYCKSFLLRTRSSEYENHLLNANIDGRSLSTYYAGSLICKKQGCYKQIETLQ
ncbi:MAG: hypothetical protein HC905_18035 [Bacteroidales bacterium]|nr:hypothetical protein [Bacteroidales bacterium]